MQRFYKWRQGISISRAKLCPDFSFSLFCLASLAACDEADLKTEGEESAKMPILAKIAAARRSRGAAPATPFYRMLVSGLNSGQPESISQGISANQGRPVVSGTSLTGGLCRHLRTQATIYAPSGCASEAGR